MACSVYMVLDKDGRADQDELAASFIAWRDFGRGYRPATNRMLRMVRESGSGHVPMLARGDQLVAGR
jgi:hypothetical protein